MLLLPGNNWGLERVCEGQKGDLPSWNVLVFRPFVSLNCVPFVFWCFLKYSREEVGMVEEESGCMIGWFVMMIYFIMLSDYDRQLHASSMPYTDLSRSLYPCLQSTDVFKPVYGRGPSCNSLTQLRQ